MTALLKRLKFLIGLALAGSIAAGTAHAADLPVKTPAYVATTPVSIWRGAYVGANLGYGWGQGEVSTFTASTSQSLDGVIGGGQIGYNWQFGSPLVLGIKADIHATDQHKDNVVAGISVTNSITYFATVRGRVAMPPIIGCFTRPAA